jgi:hypothetical protein
LGFLDLAGIFLDLRILDKLLHGSGELNKSNTKKKDDTFMLSKSIYATFIFLAWTLTPILSLS